MACSFSLFFWVVLCFKLDFSWDQLRSIQEPTGNVSSAGLDTSLAVIIVLGSILLIAVLAGLAWKAWQRCKAREAASSDEVRVRNPQSPIILGTTPPQIINIGHVVNRRLSDKDDLICWRFRVCLRFWICKASFEAGSTSEPAWCRLSKMPHHLVVFFVCEFF